MKTEGALLAIETTGPVCSAALMTKDGNNLHRASEEGLMHLTSLLPMVDGLLKEADLKPRHLGRIAVSAGPGSFTGIRIGVATARALSQTLNIPIVKVPTLETFVYIMEEKQSPFTVCCPVFDARRDQIYSGAYMLEADGRIMTLVNGGAHAPEDYFEALGRSMTALARLAKNVRLVCRFMGNGLPFFREPIEKFVADADSLGIDTAIDPAVQNARAVLEWALEHGVPEGYEEIEPIYYRKAEAQRRLEEREAAAIQENWTVRPAHENDVYGISVVERLSFGEPWLEESILSDLKLEYSEYIVCESEGHIVGYAGLHRILDEGHITNIAVHPARRMQGVGSAALKELVKRNEAKGISTFTLEVRESDAAATRFYENQGFVSEGVRKDYYPISGGGREDALIMWRRPEKGKL